MKRLGTSVEPHIYPKVAHSFVYFQDFSVNRDAVVDAWPRVMDNVGDAAMTRERNWVCLQPLKCRRLQ